MSDVVQAGRQAPWQVPVAVLAAALLFNLGQGVLRPTLPLYLQQVFAANYQMVFVARERSTCVWIFWPLAPILMTPRFGVVGSSSS